MRPDAELAAVHRPGCGNPEGRRQVRVDGTPARPPPRHHTPQPPQCRAHQQESRPFLPAPSRGHRRAEPGLGGAESLAGPGGGMDRCFDRQDRRTARLRFNLHHPAQTGEPFTQSSQSEVSRRRIRGEVRRGLKTRDRYLAPRAESHRRRGSVESERTTPERAAARC